MILANRSSAAGNINEKLHKTVCEQRNYWKNMLFRCVATIAFLCERGLPLRGSNEIMVVETMVIIWEY